MNIQVIKHKAKPMTNGNITYSSLDNPRALDDFNVNIVDLSDDSLWYWGCAGIGQINSGADLQTINTMAQHRSFSSLVFVLPHNSMYYFSYQSTFSKYYKSKRLKDIIGDIETFTLSLAIPSYPPLGKLLFERTETQINGAIFSSDFYFDLTKDILTKSNPSKKPTTIMIDECCFLTTLNVTRSVDAICAFVSALIEPHQKEAVPEWMNEIVFGDDAEQQQNIEICRQKITEAEQQIAAAEEKLTENAAFKSILYTNGDELVEVIFRILEGILDCDLSAFEDKKREDFLIPKASVTFIGEIKGITSNVKYEHITQLELHYREYLDKLAEEGREEAVKQLLIINPFRTKPIGSREPIHTDQIALANRNGCLIITTETLLRVYERFCAGQIHAADCIRVFSKKTGLLSLADFDNTEDDLEQYMV